MLNVGRELSSHRVEQIEPMYQEYQQGCVQLPSIDQSGDIERLLANADSSELIFTPRSPSSPSSLSLALDTTKERSATKNWLAHAPFELAQKTTTELRHTGVGAEGVNGHLYADERGEESEHADLQGLLSSSSGDNDDELDGTELRGVHLARAHWMQLHKLNLQLPVIQATFTNILTGHKEMRPVWQFSRSISIPDESYGGEGDDSDEGHDTGEQPTKKNNPLSWKRRLRGDTYFRQHCTSVQAAITMVMDNLDDDTMLPLLLQELGCHHFYYDTIEPHLEIMHESFLHAMRHLLGGMPDALDAELEAAWSRVWEMIKHYMAMGISAQRCVHLTASVTPAEMVIIKLDWERVVERGLTECGKEVAENALQLYAELLSKSGLANLGVDGSEISTRGPLFMKFSYELISALNKTIESYTPDRGFEDLTDELKGFVHHYIIMEVCPALVRKAFIESLLSMLRGVLGEPAMNENVSHVWSKIYRVLEQAIISNIITDY